MANTLQEIKASVQLWLETINPHGDKKLFDAAFYAHFHILRAQTEEQAASILLIMHLLPPINENLGKIAKTYPQETVKQMLFAATQLRKPNSAKAEINSTLNQHIQTIKEIFRSRLKNKQVLTKAF